MTLEEELCQLILDLRCKNLKHGIRMCLIFMCWGLIAIGIAIFSYFQVDSNSDRVFFVAMGLFGLFLFGWSFRTHATFKKHLAVLQSK